jgi:hypothetical protein
MKHTEKCIHQQAKQRMRRDRWVRLWPNYCRYCNGAGAFYWEELGSGPMSEPCEYCTASGYGICPRCGHDRALETHTGEGPCIHCNWNYDDACPPEVIEGPCDCEIAQWKELEDGLP